MTQGTGQKWAGRALARQTPWDPFAKAVPLQRVGCWRNASLREQKRKPVQQRVQPNQRRMPRGESCAGSSTPVLPRLGNDGYLPVLSVLLLLYWEGGTCEEVLCFMPVRARIKTKTQRTLPEVHWQSEIFGPVDSRSPHQRRCSPVAT